jgi:beta-lactamase regulating signal transducer with metallopeptidase domain
MTPSNMLLPVGVEAVVNHLWQSTLFALIAALLALVFRNNRAEVRYWLWLAASVKFLVPFGALVTLGSYFAGPSAPPQLSAEMMRLMDGMSRPFSWPQVEAGAVTAALAGTTDGWTVPGWVLRAVWMCGLAVILGSWSVRWRRTAAIARIAQPILAGREIDTLRRLERMVGITGPVSLVSSRAVAAPGVFGIVRPVILWPHRLGEQLDDQHVAAILTHELMHVRRRDNLTAAIHAVVQTLFWFHPLTWFIGSRLVHERERACDEASLSLGSEPQVYAESILKTCQFSLGLPPALVAGAGSNLKQRIEAIMSKNTGQYLSVWKQLLLAAAVLAAAVGPIAAGAVQGVAPPAAQPVVTADPQARAQFPQPLGRVVGRYEHLRTGITFDVPEGWTLVNTFPSSDNGEQVMLQRMDPPAMLQVWMVKERVEPFNIGPWLDGAPQQKFEQRNGGYAIPNTEGYRIRAESVHRAMFGPHNGIVAIADYTDLRMNTAMAEYMTWIYTEKGRTFFFARVAASDLVQLQPHVDRIVNSAVIP